jgi:hypothetical protein
VLEAKEVAERHSRERPSPPVPRNWPKGPYTDGELRSIGSTWRPTWKRCERHSPAQRTRPTRAPLETRRADPRQNCRAVRLTFWRGEIAGDGSAARALCAERVWVHTAR